MPRDEILVLRNVAKSYRMGDNEVAAVRGVTLSIREGEFIAITGPSGSGKSTLMHILGLLDKPDSGTYELQGRDVSRLAPRALASLRNAEFGFVFQQFNLLARTTCVENASLPLLYRPGRLDLERVRKVLGDVGLADRLEHHPNQLSGGQQQRVAIARALAGQPRIILADEPTGNLDTASAAEIMSILTRLNDEGITVILVTHESDVAQYARRTIHMRDGRIASDERRADEPSQASPARAELDRPGPLRRATFAARMLGSHVGQAFRALAAHKVRSFLSMLGILIGVASVVTIVALGEGAKEAIKTQFSALGSNLLVLRSGFSRSHGSVSAVGTVARLREEDVEAISKLSSVRSVAPSVSAGAQVVYQNKNWRTEVLGTTPEHESVRSMTPIAGRFITSHDMATRARVAVLGPTVVTELFGDANPMGEFIKVDRVIFQVVGILPPKGAAMWRNRDDQIIIPMSTAMHRLMGKDYIDSVDIEIVSGDLVAPARESVLEVVRRLHRLPPDDEDSFAIFNMAELLQSMTETTRMISWLLTSIAIIALLVGGIGIMNIMLVSVTERTREIGLRMAIGATGGSILAQFLIETVVVSVLGGLCGLALAGAATVALTELAGWTTSLPLSAVYLAVFYSSAIGIVFGLWPARQASRLNPIDALRYE